MKRYMYLRRVPHVQRKWANEPRTIVVEEAALRLVGGQRRLERVEVLDSVLHVRVVFCPSRLPTFVQLAKKLDRLTLKNKLWTYFASDIDWTRRDDGGHQIRMTRRQLYPFTATVGLPRYAR